MQLIIAIIICFIASSILFIIYLMRLVIDLRKQLKQKDVKIYQLDKTLRLKDRIEK